MACSVRFFQLIALRFKGIEKAGMRRERNGFSLIEILIVVGIIGLLVGLVGPSALLQFQGSKVKTAEIQIEQIKSALDLFLIDVGRYPDSSEGLEVLVKQPAGLAGWNGPYLRDGKLPLDPWGRTYNMKVTSGARIQIESLGADGQPGGEGNNRDIVS